MRCDALFTGLTWFAMRGFLPAFLGWVSLGVASAFAAPPKFGEVGVEFLERHCVACHGSDEPEGSIDLAQFHDEPSVLKDRVTWDRALKLVQSGQMPPPDEARPEPAEIESFVTSVSELFAAADRAAPPRVGKITVRRLNRVEYNNTIRDLVGVDFDPAADFPSDDVGHGFDNMGDVLSISPVLMERYLAASESIVQRAITPQAPPVPKRHLSTRYAEPASANVPFEDNYRRLTMEAEGDGVATGPIFTTYKNLPTGEYVFRVKAYARRDSDKPVHLALLASGPELSDPASDAETDKLWGKAVESLRPLRVLKTVEVQAREKKHAEVIEIKLPSTAGITRMAVALVKTPNGEPPAELFVEYLALEGPLDTRPESHRRLLDGHGAQSKAEQTRTALRRFASRAYRRPATEAEVARLAALVESVTAGGESWETAMQRAIQAVLVSPKFLFRLELDDRPVSARPEPLDEYQLASRLSYFLWSSMPDDELFGLAEKKQLAANLEPQVRRMLRDPKSQALVDNFALQWLQLRRLETVIPDSKQFPSFDGKLRGAMLEETRLFLTEIIREDRSALDLINADYTYLNETLAHHYGIVDTLGTLKGHKPQGDKGEPLRGPEFRRVTLHGGDRGGLLTQASVLTVTSNPTRTSPVKRGRWVMEQILGTPPPPPPPDVPELQEGAQAELTGTLRERMKQHMENPSCAGCHVLMDPLGFAFENFDAIGRYRTKDGEHPIDPAGKLPDGREFAGPAELKAILREQSGLFRRCLTEKMLIYALGRGLEPYDRTAVSKIETALAADDHKFSRLVIEIVRSDPFRLRPGKEPTP